MEKILFQLLYTRRMLTLLQDNVDVKHKWKYSRMEKILFQLLYTSRMLTLLQDNVDVNIISTFIKAVIRQTEMSKNKNDLVNQESQCIQFDNPIIFMDSFNRHCFSCTSSYK